jgi:hypothetical protein
VMPFNSDTYLADMLRADDRERIGDSIRSGVISTAGSGAGGVMAQTLAGDGR